MSRYLDDGAVRIDNKWACANGFVFFRDNFTTPFEGVLPREHGVVSVLSGFPRGQFGGRHEAVSDVMTVA